MKRGFPKRKSIAGVENVILVSSGKGRYKFKVILLLHYLIVLELG